MPWFAFLQNKVKTIEGRLAKPGKVASSVQPGDTITFVCGLESFDAIVVRCSHYACIEDYLIVEGLSNCLPGVDTINEGVDIYHQFYSAEAEARYGVMAIEIQSYNN